MSYENGTIHYNLPQTVNDDKRDWFDTNEAFADIDSALHTAVQTCEANAEQITIANSAISALDTRVSTTEDDIVDIKASDDSQNESIATINTKVANNFQDLLDMICAYQEETAVVQKNGGYHVGDYFIYNETLWKATSTMSKGTQIIPSTNCINTTLTELIKALEQS